jgi:hypothetical protein
MRRLFFAFVLTAVSAAVLAATPAAAQIQSRPSDPPIVTADNDQWYRQAEPLQFAGDVYFPAGPAVFFNGNTMVRTGHYNGVPLYSDTTLEPFSIVYVPLSRGLMQPYERPRRGALAGTTGSRTPSFPVEVSNRTATTRITITEPAVVSSRGSDGGTPGAVGTGGYAAPRSVDVRAAEVRPANPRPIVTLRRPENNDGVWVAFGGEKWVSAGAAVPFAFSDFVRVGEHAGFPVYARRELKEEMIYLPAREGAVAPYRLKN